MNIDKVTNYFLQFLGVFFRISFSIFIVLTLFTSFTKVAYATTYYVDATTGSDSDTGLTEDLAWQTINKVNISSFNPGDNIYFKRGEMWREQLTVPSSGTSGNLITFGAYGSGENPKIYRSDNYTNWWEQTVIGNSDLELYTGTINDGVSDTFTEWVYFADNGNTVEAISPAYSLNTAVKVTKLYQPTSSAILRTNSVPIEANTTYYLEFYGKRESGLNDCRVFVNDLQSGLFLYEDGSWAANIDGEQFEPNSLRTTESEWTLKSKSFTTLPSADNLRFQFSVKYNQQATCIWDAIYLKKGTSKDTVKVWTGQSSTIGSSKGLIVDGERIPVHLFSDWIDPLGLEEGYFHNPSGGSYSDYFFYRNDSGFTSTTEVGARKYGIYISGKSYLIITDIDVYGVGGHNLLDTANNSGIMIDSSSSNIKIKNLTMSYTEKYGVNTDNTAIAITYDNLSSHNNGSTGIYINSNGGSVLNSQSYNNGKVITDSGDRGGIGSFEGVDILVSNNEVYQNGLEDSDADFEISFVAGGTITAINNYVHDCDQGCIQIAEGGDNSIIANNIINNYGTSSYVGESYGKFSGIRIGGGVSGAANVKIYNNTFANGSTVTSNNGSSIVLYKSDTTGTFIKNNIFHGSAIPAITVHTDVVTTDHEYNNNLYYRSDYTNAWNWKGINYSSLESWQDATSQDTNSIKLNPLFINADGNNFNIKSGSPAIDTGVDVSITSDYIGTLIPQGSAPDIGAYEFLFFNNPNIGSPKGYTKDNIRPTLIFNKSADTGGGISSYKVELDAGKNQSYSISGIPANGDGSSSYVWKDNDDVKVEFVNEHDSDSNNDEIRVYFKGLSNSELTEGKHTWKVTTYDTASNSNSKDQEFYIDKTNPSMSETTIADISSIASGTTYNLPITNRTPSFSGLVTDLYKGSEVTNSNGSKDTFSKVSSAPKTVSLTIFKLKNGQDSSSSNAEYEEYSSEEITLENIKDEIDDKKTARFYITTPFPLVDGYYKMQLSTKDGAGNEYSQPDFYLSLNNQSSINNTTKLQETLFTGGLDLEITKQETIPAETDEEKQEVKEQGYIVRVKVVDDENNPVAGASVTIHSKVQETTSDENGIATFTNVEPGDHRIIIAYNGFEGEQKVTLTGDVKEFSFDIKVTQQNPLLTPQVIILAGVFLSIITTLIIFIIRSKSKKLN